MATKKKQKLISPELEQLIAAWDEQTFTVLVCEGNRKLAEIADLYRAQMASIERKDPVPKKLFAEQLVILPVLDPKERCRGALDAVVDMGGKQRQKGHTLEQYTRLVAHLHGAPTDHFLVSALEYAYQGDIVQCATHAARYVPGGFVAETLALSWILKHWMVQI